jgi:tetratricopeptide (TPR) repeat protein
MPLVSSATLPVDSLWNRAGNKYSEGKYGEAAQLYEQILNENGESSELYFNLGNAYFKQNLPGQARLNYERALRLDPANTDIRHNLEYAEAMQTDKIDEVKEVFLTSWMNEAAGFFSTEIWTIVFFVFAAAALLMLYFFIFSHSPRAGKLLFAGLCLSIFIGASSLYLGYRQRGQMLNRMEAIIYSPEVTVKSTPGNSGADLFIIHEGLKVKIIEKQGNYYRIMLKDGKSQGWIPRESAEII